MKLSSFGFTLSSLNNSKHCLAATILPYIHVLYLHFVLSIDNFYLFSIILGVSSFLLTLSNLFVFCGTLYAV